MGNNVWLLGFVDDGMLKMVKIRITHHSKSVWLGTRYDRAFGKQCSHPTTFTDACFKGNDPKKNIFPVKIKALEVFRKVSKKGKKNNATNNNINSSGNSNGKHSKRNSNVSCGTKILARARFSSTIATFAATCHIEACVPVDGANLHEPFPRHHETGLDVVLEAARRFPAIHHPSQAIRHTRTRSLGLARVLLI